MLLSWSAFLAPDEAVLFECAQAEAEGAGADGAACPGQLAEALWAVCERGDDDQRPFVAEEIAGGAQSRIASSLGCLRCRHDRHRFIVYKNRNYSYLMLESGG